MFTENPRVDFAAFWTIQRHLNGSQYWIVFLLKCKSQLIWFSTACDITIEPIENAFDKCEAIWFDWSDISGGATRSICPFNIIDFISRCETNTQYKPHTFFFSTTPKSEIKNQRFGFEVNRLYLNDASELQYTQAKGKREAKEEVEKKQRHQTRVEEESDKIKSWAYK